MRNNFTVLIQGPLNNISINNIKNYQKFAKKIVISHWDEDTTNIKKDFPLVKKLINKENIKIISNPIPNLENKRGILKDSTFYLALESTYKGIIECDTEYIIKTRSDEYFTNLQAIVDKTLDFKGNKIVCGNIFVKNYKNYPMHIGDHIFCIKKKTFNKNV